MEWRPWVLVEGWGWGGGGGGGLEEEEGGRFSGWCRGFAWFCRLDSVLLACRRSWQFVRVDDFLCDDNGRTADRQCRRTTYASVIVAAQPRLTLRGAAAGPWAALALARNVEIVACHWPKGLDALEWGRIRGGRPARPAGGPIVGWDSTYPFFARGWRSVPFGVSQGPDLSRQLHATTALGPTDRQAQDAAAGPVWPPANTSASNTSKAHNRRHRCDKTLPPPRTTENPPLLPPSTFGIRHGVLTAGPAMHHGPALSGGHGHDDGG